MRLLYLRKRYTVEPDSFIGRSLVRHLALENEVVLRSQVADVSALPDWLERLRDELVDLDELAGFDAVFIEGALTVSGGEWKVPPDALDRFVRAGGQVVLADMNRDVVGRGAITAEFEQAFGVTYVMTDSGHPEYLLDEGARGDAFRGSWRMHASEQLVSGWVKECFHGVDSLVVSAPAALHTLAAEPLASSNWSASMGDTRMNGPDPWFWASVLKRGAGHAVLLAANFSHDLNVDACPDNARWLSNVLSAMHTRSREELAWQAGPVTPPTAAAVPGTAAGGTDVAGLLAQEEGLHLERKASARLSVPDGAKMAALEHAVAKSVAGMLNADGGTVLVGVADHGTVVGLEREFGSVSPPTADAYERWLLKMLAHSLGMPAAVKVRLEWHVVDGRRVVALHCGLAADPVFVAAKKGVSDAEGFYVRLGNATEWLSGRAMSDYIRQRF